MNVSRHIAKDMRTALGLVREVHGPDAVILSNRRVPEGIEITATADYDESLLAPKKTAPEKYTFPSVDDETDGHQHTTQSVEKNVTKTEQHVAQVAENTNNSEKLSKKQLAEILKRRQIAAESLAATIKKQAEPDPSGRQQATKPVQDTEQDFTVELSRAARQFPEIEKNASLQIPEQEPELEPDLEPEIEQLAVDESFQQPARQIIKSGSSSQETQAEQTTESSYLDMSMDSLLNPDISMADLPEPLDQSIARKTQTANDLPLQKEESGTTLKQSQTGQGPEVLWNNDAMLDDMRKELLSLRSLVETQISGFAWGEINRRNPVQAGIMRQLAALGLTSSLARSLSDNIPEDLGHRKAWFRALAMLAQQLPVAGDTILTQGGIVALVGPAGVGKTTMIAKLAVQYAMRHGRENVAMITTDSSRFGAFDQIRNLGSILKIPVRAVGSGPELEAALDHFNDRRLVLVDTAGLSHRDERLSRTLETLRLSCSRLKAYMVMSASTQADSLQQMIAAFKPVNPCGCIISKIDECSSLGPVLSAVIEHKLPVSYFSEGQKIPDDLKIAQVQELVGKAVAISKSMNAFENTEDLMIEQMLMGESL